MGCNTFFYKKWDNEEIPTVEEAKQHLIESTKAYIEDYEAILKILQSGGSLDEDEQDLFEMTGGVNTPEEYVQKRIQAGHDSIIWIQNLSDEDTIQYYAIGMYDYDTHGIVRYYNDAFYCTKIDGKNLLPQVFTVYDYPEDVLTCFEDFKNFWNEHDCKLGWGYTEEQVMQEMKKFWEDYPDGIVDFG